MGWGGVSENAQTVTGATPTQPSTIKGEGFGKSATLAALLLLAACGRQQQASPFPEPHRPVSPISSRYLNENDRESLGEFQTVSRFAEVQPRMSVDRKSVV